MEIDKIPIPGLAEDAESWICEAIDDTGCTAVHCLRVRNGKARRLGTWRREHDGDLGQWVVDRARSEVLSNGACTVKLDRPGVDPCEWAATLPQREAFVPMQGPSNDPQMLIAWLQYSFDLMFRMGEDMRQTYAVLPRLISPIIELQTETLRERREAARESEAVTVAAIEQEGSGKRLDKIESLLTTVMSTTKAMPGTGKSAAEWAQEIIGALTEEERAQVLATPIGNAVILARDVTTLASAVSEIWAANKAGAITLSGETLDRVRPIVKRFNGGGS